MIKKRINFVDLNQVNKKYKKSYLRLIKKIYDSSSFIKSRYNLILNRYVKYLGVNILYVNSGTVH